MICRYFCGLRVESCEECLGKGYFCHVCGLVEDWTLTGESIERCGLAVVLAGGPGIFCALNASR